MISTKEPVCFDLELMGRGAEIYFMFGAYHLPSGKKIKIEGNTPESLDKLHEMLPRTVHYAFNPDGFMVVTRDDQPDQTERWGVNLLAQDFTSGGTDFKARDLIMSLDDGHGNVVYRRLLRPISPTE